MQKIVYLCDRRACLNGCSEFCSLTSDISHAVNFELDGGVYTEKIQKNNSLNDISKLKNFGLTFKDMLSSELLVTFKMLEKSQQNGFLNYKDIKN